MCDGAGAGTITEEGHIACHCKQCRANGKVRTAGVSCSEFEEHAGSRERRPGESIYLTRLSISLKVQSMPFGITSSRMLIAILDPSPSLDLHVLAGLVGQWPFSMKSHSLTIAGTVSLDAEDLLLLVSCCRSSVRW